MKKKTYQCPCTCAFKIIGRTIISASIIIGGSDDKIGDEGDIGFVKEQDQLKGDNNVWSNEW